MKKIVFISGIPGSGKSTLAEKVAEENSGQIFTTDDFFIKNGEYKFSGKFISAAHKWNLGRVALAMFNDVQCIIVPNTNLQAWEILPYCELAIDNGYILSIMEPKTKWKNDAEECFKRCTHNVPLETIKAMIAKKQSIKDMKQEIESKLKKFGEVAWAV